MAVPAGEAMQAAQRFHDIGARPCLQVVRVGQHHLEAQLVIVAGVEMDDRTACAHRHEHRRLEAAAGSGYAAPPGLAIRSQQLEGDPASRRRRGFAARRAHARSLSLRASSIASPKDKKR